MPKVVKYEMYEPEDMKIILEAPRNGDAGLNTAVHGLSFSKIYRERHLDGKRY
jgi:hypothetical protein